MGINRQGASADVRFWAPRAKDVKLAVFDGPDHASYLPLHEDADGVWNGTGSWDQLQGKSYAFAVTTPEGETQLHTDPYARQVQGQLRGVGYAYRDAQGAEVNKFAPGAVPYMHFEVQQQPDAEKVELRLSSGAEVPLTRKGDDAWTAELPNPQSLKGQSYQFEVWKHGQLVGDTNHDGKLSSEEARATVFNDPYDNRLEQVDSQRLGVVSDGAYRWKNPTPSFDAKKAVTYQLHVGSFMGTAGNERRSTFKDLIDRLDYFKELGVNTLEMLPTSPFEGSRDWGYIGTNSTAVAEQYGFSDSDGRWVSGPEALKRFVDEAHGRGIAVIGDVVYNHLGGDYNSLWKVDGNANSYFNWGPEGNKGTPWGPMPAYNQPAVRQFVVDSAMTQLDDYHLDGLRFDFTHLIHAQEGGGQAGWSMLQELTQKAHQAHPQAFLAAEEFPNHPVLTTSPANGGAGFDAVWNTEFQHRLVHDNDNPSILQQAARGQWTNVDQFMNHLVNHPGFASEQNSVTVISNHDEVGNAERTVQVAGGPDSPWARAAARATFGVGMLSPGEPIFFQGEESLATNPFKWGVPSSWDTGWKWHDADPSHLDAADRARLDHFRFCQDAIALRQSSDAFRADVPAHRVYTHNDDSVLAFSRQSGRDTFVVVSSLNHNPLPNYRLPLEAGKWQLVLDSDDAKYGGSGLGKSQVEGGDTRLDLAPGSTLVYKKIG